MKSKRLLIISFIILFAVLTLTTGISAAKQANRLWTSYPQLAVGNGFTYQGYLTDGDQPANGSYDFYFGAKPKGCNRADETQGQRKRC